ncbi:MAG: diadenylate cyclase CdaA [Acidobacteriota bacterium]
MMAGLLDTFHFSDFGLRSVLEVSLLAFLIYRLLLMIRGTRAVQMLYGLMGLLFVFWITGPGMLDLRTLHQLLVTLSFYIPIAIVVVFQNTLRRALTGFGINPLGRLFSHVNPEESQLDLVVSAAYTLAGKRIGALIVLEREQGLRNWIESGILLDARISYDLIVNVFSPYTPLHDGALIIGNGRLKAASCFLPLTSNPTLSTMYGTRHRAGIGITEETDAISVIVSEERGVVSLAREGIIRDALKKSDLKQLLHQAMSSPSRHQGKARGTEAGGLSQDERQRHPHAQPASASVSAANPGGEANG